MLFLVGDAVGLTVDFVVSVSVGFPPIVVSVAVVGDAADPAPDDYCHGADVLLASQNGERHVNESDSLDSAVSIDLIL